MTTREFIKKWYGNSTKERYCSSVMVSSNGTVYSYGFHYPLLFKVAGHDFINTMGYSNTTARHIRHAMDAVDYNYTAVELNRDDARTISSSWASDTDKLAVLLRATAEMVANAQVACDAKKRKDTQVYHWLADTLGKAQASHIMVTNLMEGN